MSTISKYQILTKAKESFNKAEYKSALEKFAIVLQNYPNSKEAYNGVILSEMAMSGEGGAEAENGRFLLFRCSLCSSE